MTRTGVEQYLYLLDESFEGIDQPWHSLLGNLASVTESDWLWAPPGGARTIRQITAHVGGAVYLYYDRAFGNCSVFGDPIVSWDVPAGYLGVGTEQLSSERALDNEPPMASVIQWVAERAGEFRHAVSRLDDASLMEARSNHRGVSRTLRWFIVTMAQHYSYHAGEINHIRALHQGNDGES